MSITAIKTNQMWIVRALSLQYFERLDFVFIIGFRVLGIVCFQHIGIQVLRARLCTMLVSIPLSDPGLLSFNLQGYEYDDEACHRSYGS